MTGDDITLPHEVAVALVFNGSTAAVMMASPDDHMDFLRGFAVSEGVVDAARDVTDIEVIDHPNGIEVRGRIPENRAKALNARRRALVGPVGCGLCGIESLDAAMSSPPCVPAAGAGIRAAARAALAELDRLQAHRVEPRAMHAAAFFNTAGIVLMREDVGRHNALDKVIGAVGGMDVSAGGVLLTSRVSLDLLQKCARAGVPALCSVSRPTRAAVDLARRVGMTLCTLTPQDDLVFSAPGEVPE